MWTATRSGRMEYPDGREELLGLILIDTPETADPNTPDECFGDRSSEYTAERLAPGTPVWLESDVSDRDRFDRLLRYVWYDDGSGTAVLFNERIVADGFAVLSIYPPDVKHEDRIQKAQQPAPAPAARCHPSYSGVCIPPPDLDCGEIGFRRFQVVRPDPHGFDGGSDGISCES